jgi:hypothetical protein
MSAREHANDVVVTRRIAKKHGIATEMLPADAKLGPDFVRLPGVGESERCPVTGMSRTWLIERIRESRGTKHAIKAHHLRTRGANRGTVLIDRASLVKFVASFPPPEWDGEKPTKNRRKKS